MSRSPFRAAVSSVKNAFGFPLPTADAPGDGVESGPARLPMNLGDPTSNLAGPVLDRLRQLEDESSEARSVWEGRRDSSEAQRARVRELEKQRSILAEHGGSASSVRQPDGEVSFAPGLSKADRLADAERRLEAGRREFERLHGRTEEARQRYDDARRVHDLALRYVRAHGLSLSPAAFPAIGKASPEALAKVLEEIAVLDADAHEVRSAPVPSNVAKERLRGQVAALAAHGRPDVGPLIDSPDGEVRWPTSQVVVGNLPGAPRGNLRDALALVCWMYGADLVEALEREIDELADDAAALDEPTRRKKLAAIADQKLAAERRAVAIVDVLKANGTWTAFPEVDIRAVLHANGPAAE